MFTTSMPHSLSSILLCSLALASSVTSSALPADAHNRPRDTSCAAKYGYIQIIDPNNAGATPAYYVDTASSPDNHFQFLPTPVLSSAGIFKYQNCQGYGVSDLETINYTAQNSTFRLFGLTQVNDAEWLPFGVNHIGGSGPFYFPSDESLPATEGIDFPFTSESAVWSFASDGTLISQLTTTAPSFVTQNAWWNNGALSFMPVVTKPALARTLKFIPVEIGFGQTCRADGWSDAAPCATGTCTQLTLPVLDVAGRSEWVCI